jgi:choline dehydrogenase-like flavoprotein
MHCIKQSTTKESFFSVGGGSAGSVLASRLSEDASTSVLLIEAGGAPSFLTGIPGLNLIRHFVKIRSKSLWNVSFWLFCYYDCEII